MSREIKFRQPLRDRKGNFTEWFYWGFIDGDFITPANQLNGNDTKGESQQYTGLKDRHGKDIFEGDLVAEVNNIDELEKWGTPLTVCFGEFVGDNDSFGLPDATTGFYLRYNKGGSDGQKTGLHNHESAYGFEAREIMVLGNIYETPELL